MGYGLYRTAKPLPKSKAAAEDIKARRDRNDSGDDVFDSGDGRTPDTTPDADRNPSSNSTFARRQGVPKKPPPTAAEVDMVIAAAATNPAHRVIYTPTYGSTFPRTTTTKKGASAEVDTARRRPTFLVHVLALTFDKLLYYSRRHPSPQAATRPRKRPKTGGRVTGSKLPTKAGSRSRSLPNGDTADQLD
jgi:hypothetical protein